MSSVSDPFIELCLELLRPLGGVRGRRMFSGYGIYADEVFVAVAVREELFLKVDAETQPKFEAAGGHPFEYEMRGKLQRLGFWTVPPEAMESLALMQPWARLALAAALRARAAKPVAKKRPAAKKKPAAQKRPAAKKKA